MPVRLLDDRVEATVEAGQDELAGVLNLEGQRGVDHVRGRQPVVNPATDWAELLRDGVHEGGDVMVGHAPDLRDALRRRRDRMCADLGDRLGGYGPDLRPRVER